LKKITKRYTNTSSFCRETDALLRIYNNGGHPNISGLRDMYEDHDYYYLVMDLVSGGEMFDHLIQYGAYSEADAARLMREVASALAFLHGVGVVHADLKPENLLLCSKKREDGTVKMIDFGCALVHKDTYSDNDDDDDHKSNNKSGEEEQNLNLRLNNWIEEFQESNASSAKAQNDQKDLQFTGTTAYWPPERFLPNSFPDAATDMWAVGIILFIMLTGVHPFDLTGVATDDEIEEQIKKDPSPPITPALTSHLSPYAIDLIKKLFAKDPDERLTADGMLMHPWIAGDEATTEVMEKSAQKLSKFKDLRAIIEAGIFSILVEQGSREMFLSEYTPKMVYKDDSRGIKGSAPATSVLKRAFDVFDEEGKGFVSADDLGRVVSEHTGQHFSEEEKEDMMAVTAQASGNETDETSGLSLSSFSNVFAGLKHKHYPRGHIIFHAGDQGDAMYFINSGKTELHQYMKFLNT
jgi:serine/threonine protein kinase